MNSEFCVIFGNWATYLVRANIGYSSLYQVGIDSVVILFSSSNRSYRYPPLLHIAKQRVVIGVELSLKRSELLSQEAT